MGTNEDDLTRLIAAGPDPAHELQHRVMMRFYDITAARMMARTWREIAVTLGLAGRQKGLAAAYWRVRRGIEAGRLAVPGTDRRQVASSGATPATTPPTAAPRGHKGNKDFLASLPQIGGKK